ncbi:hypothetical protein Pelo_1867 [Pelomyxa schiedti]|nr:hypothetical protein Pelo_1867 [Pelomyxa schiedti]
MAHIAEVLWDGFDKTMAKVDINIRTMKEYYEFFNKRSGIERDYGRHLMDLCKMHPGGKTPAVDKMEKTMKGALVTVSDSGQRVALKHTDVSTKITNEIVKPIEAAVKQSDLDKKRILADGTRRIKIYMDSVNAANKAHENYIKACKESEVAKDQYLRAEAEVKAAPEPKKTKLQQNMPKFQTKRSQCIEKANQMEAAYKASVTATNEAQQKLYSQEMPVVLADLEKVIETQFTCMSQCAKNFLNMQRDFPPEHTAAIDTINTAVNDLSWANDLQEFIDATRNPTATGPTPMEFIAFEGKTSDALPGESASATPATTTAAPTVSTTTTPTVTPTPATTATPTATATPTPETTEAKPAVDASVGSSSGTPSGSATTTTGTPAETTTPATTTPTPTAAVTPTPAPKADPNLFDASGDLFGDLGTKKPVDDPADSLFS